MHSGNHIGDTCGNAETVTSTKPTSYIDRAHVSVASHGKNCLLRTRCAASRIWARKSKKKIKQNTHTYNEQAPTANKPKTPADNAPADAPPQATPFYSCCNFYRLRRQGFQSWRLCGKYLTQVLKSVDLSCSLFAPQGLRRLRSVIKEVLVLECPPILFQSIPYTHQRPHERRNP